MRAIAGRQRVKPRPRSAAMSALSSSFEQGAGDEEPHEAAESVEELAAVAEAASSARSRGGPHPWYFIQEAALKCVSQDFKRIRSKIQLCKTFRLEEDGKILTPEETLYQSVRLISAEHDRSGASPDVKFRSFICAGLNEQALHLWFEALCNCTEVVERYYSMSSFIRSPCWLQIKAELRLLSQFAFTLRLDSELANRAEIEARQLRAGVADMLTKHHLFSWDLE